MWLLDQLTSRTAIKVSKKSFYVLVVVASAVSSCGSGNPPEVTKDVTEREKLELAVGKAREAIPLCDGIAVMNDGSYGIK